MQAFFWNTKLYYFANQFLVWTKVKAAAGKLSGKIRDDVKAAIENLKPQILDRLNKVKEIVINAGKQIIIQVRDDIVRIITGATKGESEIETYGLSDCKFIEFKIFIWL